LSNLQTNTINVTVVP